MMNDSIQLTPVDHAVLDSYKTLCEGLAQYLGEGYEFVLHSLENYDRSVIKIINGYYTGRKEGAPITDLALRMLEDIRNHQGRDYISYNSRNKKGEPLHSTTIAIRGENQRIIGLLCINFYLNTPYSAIIKNLIDARETSVAGGENFVDEPAQLVSEAVNEMQRIVLADASIPASDKTKKSLPGSTKRAFSNSRTAWQIVPPHWGSAEIPFICISAAVNKHTLQEAKNAPCADAQGAKQLLDWKLRLPG